MDQELLMRLQMMHQQSQELEEQLRIVDAQMEELHAFKTNLGALETSKETEMLASLGKGVFIQTNIESKQLFVEVGQGYLVRKHPNEALTIIEGQTRRLGELRVQIEGHYEQLVRELRVQIEALEGQENQ